MSEREQSLVPLLISLAAAEAGVFLVSSGALLGVAGGVLLVTGALLWGWRWLGGLALLCLPPMAILGHALFTSAAAEAWTAFRWILSVLVGSFHIRMMGVERLGKRLLEVYGGSGGPLGRFAGSLGEVLCSAGGVLAESKRSIRSATGCRPSLVISLFLGAVESSDVTTDQSEMQPPEGGSSWRSAAARVWDAGHLLVLALSWVFMLLGVLGL